MNNSLKGAILVLTVLLVIVSIFAVSLLGSLNTTRAALAETEAVLANTRAQLTEEETKLDLANARLTHTQMALDNINNQLQIANETNGQMLNQYTSLCNKINARCGDTQQDRQSFITPTDTTISNKVQEIVGGYSDNVNERWGDYERLYRWVVNNMDYSYDTYTPYLPSSLSGAFEWRKDFWRMPAETLADETGDCEDMALLLASMMKNYNQGKFAVWVIEIASGVPGNPSHLAVAIPVQDGRLTILDPAGKYYTGMYQYSSLYSESAATATNAWISYWSKEIPAAFVERIFSESEEHQFSSTSEFLAWLNQRY